MLGRVIQDRYDVEVQLGQGAMGTVYRAHDRQTGAAVALKVISSDLAHNPDALERFRREAELLKQLEHPNIVRYIDAFEHEGRYVLVMEYLPGGSLQNTIKGGPLPYDRVRQIALDLCDALIRAHRLNIIHRDIKPENILLAADGTPKLTDFGVARLLEGTRLTGTGQRVGTPYYMAPEAWEGRTLDGRADIWSLGVVLFEMLTGDVPFGGDTLVAVMNKVLTAPLPDLRAKRAEIPSALAQIVTRMLVRDRAGRYQSMRDVAADLERGQASRSTTPSGMANEWLARIFPRWLGLRGSLAILGLILIAAIWFLVVSRDVLHWQEVPLVQTSQTPAQLVADDPVPTLGSAPTYDVAALATAFQIMTQTQASRQTATKSAGDSIVRQTQSVLETRVALTPSSTPTITLAPSLTPRPLPTSTPVPPTTQVLLFPNRCTPDSIMAGNVVFVGGVGGGSGFPSSDSIAPYKAVLPSLKLNDREFAPSRFDGPTQQSFTSGFGFLSEFDIYLNRGTYSVQFYWSPANDSRTCTLTVL